MKDKEVGLYPLKPIGISTPLVESLSSYLSRLAITHSLKLIDLINRVLLPIASIKAFNFDYMQACFIIGFSEKTEKLIQVLQCLTGQRNLETLTLLPVKDLISSRNLVKQHQSWCPTCYNEWRDQGHEIYQPLLWNLVPVKICIRHNTRLAEQCPFCGRKLSLMNRIHIIGYCTHCYKWLGCFEKVQNINVREKWIVSNLGKLVACSEELININPYFVHSNVMQKNVSVDKIDSPDNIELSSIGSLVLNSYRNQVPLIDLLTKDLSLIINQKNIERISKIQNPSRLQYIDEIAVSLYKILKSDEAYFPSVLEISKELKILPFEINKNWPDLYKEILARSKAHRKGIKEKGLAEMHRTMLEMRNRGQNPSFDKIKKLSNFSYMSKERYYRCIRILEKYNDVFGL
ncbi:MAG: TniQ family protein [Syntrophomonas sp.]